ncbi:sensor histidine kinase [Agrococcus casei]|uniref:histidine kinase n=1 Tax=Agrococcus casei LMG 22410 TaxID=1255656 RepID=A0A1R4G4W0_9MICO|nr:histidine kinase [Agrococcus casei]SJM63290.1 two-component system sensor kinase [Agrococcus casei LMG 22410]
MFRKISRTDLLVDALIAIAVVGPLAFIDVVITYRGQVGLFLSVWPVILAFLLAGMLTVRRLAPVPVLLMAFLVSAVHVLVLAEGIYASWFAVLLLLATVGRFATTKLEFRLTAGVVVLAAALVTLWSTGALLGLGSLPAGSDIFLSVLFAFLPSVLLFTGAVLAGVVLRLFMRSNREARERRKAEMSVLAQMQMRAAEEERTAIARDMHDVVAHSLAVVVAQANGARYATDAAVKDDTLATISKTASGALVDVRGLLHQLRHSQANDVSNGLCDVPDLVERMRGAGMDIRLTMPPHGIQLARASELAAYRVVQEALTNAMRHGAVGAPVFVRVDVGHELIVNVHNRPAQYGGDRVPSGSHGLTGMRERAALAGGSSWIGIDQGWFRVLVRMPVALQT